MEKWDLYTKYREKTGKEHIRGEKIPEEKILGDISFQEQFFYGKLYR